MVHSNIMEKPIKNPNVNSLGFRAIKMKRSIDATCREKKTLIRSNSPWLFNSKYKINKQIANDQHKINQKYKMNNSNLNNSQSYQESGEENTIDLSMSSYRYQVESLRDKGYAGIGRIPNPKNSNGFVPRHHTRLS